MALVSDRRAFVFGVDGRVPRDIAADGSCGLAGPGAGGPKRRRLVKWPEIRVVLYRPGRVTISRSRDAPRRLHHAYGRPGARHCGGRVLCAGGPRSGRKIEFIPRSYELACAELTRRYGSPARRNG